MVFRSAHPVVAKRRSPERLRKRAALIARPPKIAANPLQLPANKPLKQLKNADLQNAKPLPYRPPSPQVDPPPAMISPLYFPAIIEHVTHHFNI